MIIDLTREKEVIALFEEQMHPRDSRYSSRFFVTQPALSATRPTIDPTKSSSRSIFFSLSLLPSFSLCFPPFWPLRDSLDMSLSITCFVRSFPLQLFYFPSPPFCHFQFQFPSFPSPCPNPIDLYFHRLLSLTLSSTHHLFLYLPSSLLFTLSLFFCPFLFSPLRNFLSVAFSSFFTLTFFIILFCSRFTLPSFISFVFVSDLTKWEATCFQYLSHARVKHVVCCYDA